MTHFYNLWYLMLTYLSRWRLTSSEKVQGYTLEMSWKIFCNSLNTLKVYKSPKNIELHTIQAVMCHTGIILRHVVIYEPWKSPKDVLMRRPATYFATVLNRIMSTNLPNTLNYLQYRLLCVTQMTYRAIKVICESWTSPKVVLMRRPAAHFVTVLNTGCFFSLAPP